MIKELNSVICRKSNGFYGNYSFSRLAFPLRQGKHLPGSQFFCITCNYLEKNTSEIHLRNDKTEFFHDFTN